MENVEILMILLETARRIDKIRQVQLYDGGFISIQGEHFTITLAGKEKVNG